MFASLKVNVVMDPLKISGGGGRESYVGGSLSWKSLKGGRPLCKMGVILS